MGHACIDHGIDGCNDCGHWQDAADQREDEHERQTAALTADLRIARHDLSVAIAERDALQARIDAAMIRVAIRGRDLTPQATNDLLADLRAILSGEDVE